MTALRYGLAVLLGIALYWFCYHPWLPYSVRERSQNVTGYLVLMGGALIGGLILAWGARPHRYRIACALVAGMWIVNVWVIRLDWKVDPTSHNLLPFEFVILAIGASPAFLGAAIGGRK